jgi:hypothetical protein
MQIPEHIREVARELETLIAHGRSISSQLSGIKADVNDASAGNIFSKLLAHAITLQGAIPVLRIQAGTLIDISSAFVLARAIMEAYDSLFYIALDEMTPQEREFRAAIWHLHANERVLKILEKSGINPTLTAQRRVERDRTKPLVTGHPQFAGVGAGFQSDVRRGNCPPFHLSRAERNGRAGIDDNFYVGLEMDFSQYVHTFPHSVMAVATFNANDPSSARRLGPALGCAAGFTAKAIDGMHQIFPQLRKPPVHMESILQTWRSILETGLAERS